jgi:HK97 family phage major capsid protein
MYTNTAGRQELDRISIQMRSLVSAVETRGGRVMNSSEREKWMRLKAAYEKKEAEVLASEGRRSLSDQPGTMPSMAAIEGPGAVSEMELRNMRPHQRRDAVKSPEARAFSNYLRFGEARMGDEDLSLLSFNTAGTAQFRNAQGTTVTTQGGALVPQSFSDLLMEALLWFGGIEGVTGEFETSTGAPMPYPTVNDTTNKGRIIGQNIQVTETDLVFGQVTFNAYIFSSDEVLVAKALIDDSYFDMDALVARLLGVRLGRLMNNKMTVGSGTNEPNGIVTAAVAAGLTYTLSSSTTLDYADLVNLEHSVNPSYRNANSRFMFSDALLKQMKLLVDSQNRPLWQPGLTASFANGAAVIGSGRPTILGYPFAINDDIAAPAHLANSILFGDMSTYKVRKVGAPEVLRLVERYADYLQVGFIGFMRADAQLVDAGTHPIVVGINA